VSVPIRHGGSRGWRLRDYNPEGDHDNSTFFDDFDQDVMSIDDLIIIRTLDGLDLYETAVTCRLLDTYGSTLGLVVRLRFV
jgi:hypothetical protein